MKSRTRKKYRYVKCEHFIYNEDLLSSDPVYYQSECYCNIRDDNDEIEIDDPCEFGEKICNKCRHFFVSNEHKREYNNFGKHQPDETILERIERKAWEQNFQKYFHDMFPK